MSGYVKLYGSILQSSLWVGSDPAVKVVWITMLATADQYGVVNASVPGLAHAACVTVEDARRALATFLAPDEDSRTKEHDGRRIEEIDGGWRLLNYQKYREMQTAKQRQDAERQRRHRSQDAPRKRDMSRKSRRVALSASSSSDAEKKKNGKEDLPSVHGGQSRAETVRWVVDFYNRLTGRSVVAATQARFIEPLLSVGVTPVTVKLAFLGACLQPHYLGKNDRATEYLNPKTLLKVDTYEGHADVARRATFRSVPEFTWQFWASRYGCSPNAAMERIYRLRDDLLVESGEQPIGPAAMYNDRKRGESWETPLEN